MSQWWVKFELKGSELSLCGDTSPPSIYSMSFWCKMKWLSEFVTRWFWTHLTKRRSHGAGLRTCQSSQEIQEKLYLPTVTCDGGAPHNTAWSYLGLSMWAHKHHLYRIVALHWGAQHSRRQTKPYIYTFIYIHSTHFILFMSNSSSEKDSIYIYTYTGYIDLVQFADTKMSEKYRNANVFPLIFRDTNHEAEGRGNFSRNHFSWTKIACF